LLVTPECQRPSPGGWATVVRVVRDLLVVGVLLAAVALVADTQALQGAIPLEHTKLVMTLLTIAGSATAAILAYVVSRLAGDRRAAWLSVTYVLYTLLVIPAASIGAVLPAAEAAIGAARLAADLVMLATYPAVLWGRRMLSGYSGASWAALALVVVVGVAALAGRYPLTAAMVISFWPLRLGLATVGAVFGAAIAAIGWARRSSAWAIVGLGCAVIALSYVYRIGMGTQPIASVGLQFASMRLFGGVIVVLGLIQLVRRALRSVSDADADRQEELSQAKLDLCLAAERDHELRNGLAGLAAAAEVFRSRINDGQADVLGAAVATELTRLERLLQSSWGAGSGSPEVFQVVPLLSQLVELRRCAGWDVRLEAGPELWARGSAAVLAQVMTNILANCAEHAPGSRVRVQAGAGQGTVRILVRDSGPSPGLGGVVTGAPDRNGSSGSDHTVARRRGLGLALSRRLLQAYDGQLFVPEAGEGDAGYTVVVQLPAPVPTDRAGRPAT
jgi:two-component system, OmpR family, sensor kinase